MSRPRWIYATVIAAELAAMALIAAFNGALA